jgi:hypothetical protein
MLYTLSVIAAQMEEKEEEEEKTTRKIESMQNEIDYLKDMVSVKLGIPIIMIINS